MDVYPKSMIAFGINLSWLQVRSGSAFLGIKLKRDIIKLD